MCCKNAKISCHLCDFQNNLELLHSSLFKHNTNVVYFDQQTHAWACIPMMEKVLFSSFSNVFDCFWPCERMRSISKKLTNQNLNLFPGSEVTKPTDHKVKMKNEVKIFSFKLQFYFHSLQCIHREVPHENPSEPFTLTCPCAMCNSPFTPNPTHAAALHTRFTFKFTKNIYY